MSEIENAINPEMLKSFLPMFVLAITVACIWFVLMPYVKARLTVRIEEYLKRGGKKA